MRWPTFQIRTLNVVSGFERFTKERFVWGWTSALTSRDGSRTFVSTKKVKIPRNSMVQMYRELRVRGPEGNFNIIDGAADRSCAAVCGDEERS